MQYGGAFKWTALSGLMQGMIASMLVEGLLSCTHYLRAAPTRGPVLVHSLEACHRVVWRHQVQDVHLQYR